MKIAYDRYSAEEIEELKDIMKSYDFTYDMFIPEKYEYWARLHSKSKLPFHRMSRYIDFIDDINMSGACVIFTNIDIYVHSMEVPLEEIPKYIHSPLVMVKDIVKWRLELGK